MSADEYRKNLAEFLATQPMTKDVTYEDVTRATTREELGISSLNIILVIVNYIKERANDSVQLQPEWVSRLGDIEGIVSVIREIDELGSVRATA
ncbi:hypothetical protein ACWGKW_35065 [Streptomyces sp. NPDC054766]|uniref:hypothetical protein n=1 Tax=Streptomyces rhizosphaerihabitans TaxID=1266770 RepID=UPI0021BE5885|nr:hypothetical protein [Streptomyces rhizosphaerihabitans]MCT9008488.1 hypothetical protein [Streptomyces rhizosphaerihabitans]